MSDSVLVTETATVYLLAPHDPRISSERDTMDVIGAALGHKAQWVAIPSARLDQRFFDLSSGLAGAMLQKFVNYDLRVAIIGDISRYTAQSEPLAAFVRESNRGAHVCFLASEAALREKLA